MLIPSQKVFLILYFYYLFIFLDNPLTAYKIGAKSHLDKYELIDWHLFSVGLSEHHRFYGGFRGMEVGSFARVYSLKNDKNQPIMNALLL